MDAQLMGCTQSQQEYLADMRDQLRRKEEMMEVSRDAPHADRAYNLRAQRIQANHTATLQVHSVEYTMTEPGR